MTRAAAGAAAVSVAVALCAASPATAGSVGVAGAVRKVDATARSVGDSRSAAASGHYVVTLKSKPAASYIGGIPGIGRTKPAAGRRVAVAAPNTVKLRRYLRTQQADVATAVGAEPKQQYTVALNGFAAKLSAGQVAKLRSNPAVATVTPDQLHRTQNDKVDYDFLHLTGGTGVWNQVGGASTAGKGVVVGVIDTGIWPEAKSFAGSKLTNSLDDAHPYRAYRDGDTIVEHKADGGTFTGTCQVGEQFAANLCNTKLVGARYFDDGFLSITDDHALAPAPAEYSSARDSEGHGTHTGSEAVGNKGVKAVVDGRDLGTISGMAPGASIAVYKALWTGKINGAVANGGYTSDLVAAVDAAVSDGVDVINYSVGALDESPATDPVQEAFLSAASAGVLVSAAGGNSGPVESSLDNTSPWLVTAAASTLAPYYGSVALGNGAKFTGATDTVLTPVGPASLVLSTKVALAGAKPDEARLCYPGTLDPAKVKGKVVVCERGVVARPDKSFEVKRAGGIGMVLTNAGDDDYDTFVDLHAVPTVHVNGQDSLAVREYAAKAGATVTLLPGNTTGRKTVYPQVASFSSRGPALQAGGDIVKPDVSAPGVNILGAISPPNNHGHSFDFESGTSMAAPHIAGLAALYMARNPGLTPSEIKSAMMTTTGPTYNQDGSVSTDAFAQGSGEVDPTKMLTPGLVYDAGDDDWLGYLEGLGVKTGTGAKPIPAWNYNGPSFGSGKLIGTRTFTRTVTATTPGIYRAKVSVPGMKATVSPSILSFQNAGEKKTFKLTLTQTTAPSGKVAVGGLTWTGNDITVHSPIAVTPYQADAPTRVEGTGASGHVEYTAAAIAPDVPITARGLLSTPPTRLSVGDYQTRTHAPFAVGKIVPLTIKPGTAAVDIFIERDKPTAPDVCLTVVDVAAAQYQARGATRDQLVATGYTESAGDPIETILNNPQPGEYTLDIYNCSSNTGSASNAISVQVNKVEPTQGGTIGTFSVTPSRSPRLSGRPVSVSATWTGAPAKRHSIGYVQYGYDTGTLISIDN